MIPFLISGIYHAFMARMRKGSANIRFQLA